MPPTTAPARVGEIRFKQETTANEAIGTASTFWASSPKKLKAWDIKHGLKQASEDDPAMVLSATEDRAKLLLAKMGTLEFTCWLTGLAASTPAQDDLGLLLKGALGGESIGGAATTISGTNAGAGATAGITVTSATGMVAGAALKFVTASRTELRRIVSIAGAVITLDHDLAAVYTSGTVYQSYTIYMDPDSLQDLNDAGHLTYAALFRGQHTEDQFQERGIFFGVELADIGVNKRPKLVVTCHGQDWDLVTGVAAGTLFSEPASPNQVGPDSGLYINAQGTVTNNRKHTANIDCKLGLPVTELASPGGENGVCGHLAIGGRSTMEFETFYDSEWNIAYEAGTKLVAGLQLGNNVLITWPQLSIDETPERVGSGQNPTGVKVKMHADIGPVVTNDLTQAKVAIHRFFNT